MTPVAPALLAIGAMVASQLAFVFGDTLVKLTSETLPMGEILFVRGLICTAMIGAAVVATGQHRNLPLLGDRTVLWRLLGEVGGTFFYILALLQLPIAIVIIIFQAVPLTATGGAALFLGEAVGWRRWLAIAIGFAGVVLVVRPGLSGFEMHGALVLVSVLFIAFRDLWTRIMPAAIPTLLVTGATAIAVTAMGGVMGIWEDWVRPSGLILLQLSAAAVFLAVGYFGVIAAMRLGEMSATAPFRYVSVVFAIGIGFAVWRDVPDALTILGSLVIVGAGLYTLYRERPGKRAAAALAAAPATVPPPP